MLTTLLIHGKHDLMGGLLMFWLHTSTALVIKPASTANGSCVQHQEFPCIKAHRRRILATFVLNMLLCAECCSQSISFCSKLIHRLKKELRYHDEFVISKSLGYNKPIYPYPHPRGHALCSLIARISMNHRERRPSLMHNTFHTAISAPTKSFSSIN